MFLWFELVWVRFRVDPEFIAEQKLMHTRHGIAVEVLTGSEIRFRSDRENVGRYGPDLDLSPIL